MTDSVSGQDVLIVQEDTVLIISEGIQGPPGPGYPGIPGSDTPIATAGEAISAFRGIALNQSGNAVHATNAQAGDALRFVGIATQAAVLGGPARWKSTGGLINPAWAWDVNMPIFLGAAGELTQTPPVAPDAAFSLAVGFATSPTSMFVSLHDPILLAG